MGIDRMASSIFFHEHFYKTGLSPKHAVLRIIRLS